MANVSMLTTCRINLSKVYNLKGMGLLSSNLFLKTMNYRKNLLKSKLPSFQFNCLLHSKFNLFLLKPSFRFSFSFSTATTTTTATLTTMLTTTLTTTLFLDESGVRRFAGKNICRIGIVMLDLGKVRFNLDRFSRHELGHAKPG